MAGTHLLALRSNMRCEFYGGVSFTDSVFCPVLGVSSFKRRTRVPVPKGIDGVWCQGIVQRPIYTEGSAGISVLDWCAVSAHHFLLFQKTDRGQQRRVFLKVLHQQGACPFLLLCFLVRRKKRLANEKHRRGVDIHRSTRNRPPDRNAPDHEIPDDSKGGSNDSD